MKARIYLVLAALTLVSVVLSIGGVSAARDDDRFEFEGTIQSLPGTQNHLGDWVVSGRTVHVTSATRIEE
ncbi:MAG TPA: hypothetical protein VJQ56_15340, partial [Blastocatellia bacterium]|nr:hypothetical protein [Blastocatellia bacterium]